jgi:hypothetical protein
MRLFSKKTASPMKLSCAKQVLCLLFYSLWTASIQPQKKEGEAVAVPCSGTEE